MATETTDTHKEWILDIIDQLRKRKARPDLERITHFVERKHGIGRKETEAHLEKLVDKGIVIKVVYKRGTSYRNATKSRKRNYVSNVLNSNLASFKINEAVNSILKERGHVGDDTSSNEGENGDLDPVELEWINDGVSAKEIEHWLRENGEDIGPYPVHWAVQREVEAGRLSCLENGNYVPFREEDRQQTTDVANANSSQGSANPMLQRSTSLMTKRGRPPKLKLHIKKFIRSVSTNGHHPAPVKPVKPEEPESAPVPVMPPHVCDFCQQNNDHNRQGQPEELLFCKDCNAKAHPSCMNYAPELAERARNTAWQCIDCKTCCICLDPGDADAMLFCDACDKGYHMTCHTPKVGEKPQGKWVCSECVNDGVNIDDIDENSYINIIDSTVTDSESSISAQVKNGGLYVRPEVYPNAADWSISDVVDFFQEKGFSDYADAFKAQEIDGQSLLLLKRSDVLQGLSLKLGPALKIYNHVMKLQTIGQPQTN